MATLRAPILLSAAGFALCLGLMALPVTQATPAAAATPAKTTSAPKTKAAKTIPAPINAAQEDVKMAEAYLNSMGTLKARFVQTDNTGHQLAGDFLLKRPGRMRFEYDAPVTDFIVADGTFVHYYDGQMQQQSSAPISKTLANFFLQPKISLSEALRVDEIRREKDDTMLILTLSQVKDPLSGNLSLVFDRNAKTGALQLNRWRIVDPQGLITEVALSDIEAGIRLSNDQFHYYDPKRGRPKYN